MSESSAICHYCRESCGVTSDHIVPRHVGGCNHRINRMPACRKCNEDIKGPALPTCRCAGCLAAMQHYIDTPMHGTTDLTMRELAKVVSVLIKRVNRRLEEREKGRHAEARVRYAAEAGWDWDSLPSDEQRAWFKAWQAEDRQEAQ